MKYRRLTSEELEQLEDNFIRFLAAQSITGMDWSKMKTENPERAEELIGEFSDVVIEKTLHNVEYLEYKEKQDMKMFHCQAEKIVMYGLFAEGATDLDFTSDDAPDVKSEMSAHISALSESVANAYIADMTTPGLSFNDFASDDGLRVNAYDRAASWLVEKSEIIIAYNDPRRGDGGKGGTRETLEKAQKKVAELRDHSKLRVIPIEL